MRPLGREQRRLLLALASPSMLLLTPPDRTVRSLIARGLVKEELNCCRITPRGVYAVADEYRAGRLDEFMTKVPPAKSAIRTKQTKENRNEQ